MPLSNRVVIFLAVCFILSACAHHKTIKQKDQLFDLFNAIEITANGQLSINESALKNAKNNQRIDKELLAEWLRIKAKREPQLQFDDRFKKLHYISGQSNQSIEGDFSQSLAEYILSDDYACRSPSRARYFRERYFELFSDMPECQNALPFRQVSKFGDQKLIWVDPARIHSVHLLFAGKGEGVASRFGHMLLRFVICPTRESSTLDCKRNLSEHLVVSYRAHVNELSINSIKGLMGDYQAYLYANQFMDVYQQYAISQFRELKSLPLNFNSIQKKQLLELMAEVHWSFSGPYKFLNRNCSTYLQAAIEWIAPEKKLPVYWRPDGYFSAVINSSLSKFDYFDDKEKSERGGYYFPSTKAAYEKALDLVYASMQSPSFYDLDSYIETSPRFRYQNVLDDFLYHIRLKQDTVLIQAQLLLEELSLLRYESMIMSKLSIFVENNGIDNIVIELKKKLDPEVFSIVDACLIAPIRSVYKPVKIYRGIPLELDGSEHGNVLSCRQLSHKNKKLMNDILADMDRLSWDRILKLNLYRAEALYNIERFRVIENLQNEGW